MNKNSEKWWKSPVLQGPENDYGDYDYLIEEIPENTRERIVGKCKCSSCGKNRCVSFVYTEYFRTLDGWDSISITNCWRCELHSLIHKYVHRYAHKIKNKIKIIKLALEFKSYSDKISYKKAYELAKTIIY